MSPGRIAIWCWQRIGDASVLAWLAPAVPMSGGAAYWGWVSQWGYLPIALTALGVFVVTIWGVNGVIWLRRQNRPSRSRLIYDYSYGLVLEDIPIAFDLANEANVFEPRLRIRNHASGPIRYIVENIRITFQDRFFEAPAKYSGFLARGAATTLFPGGGFTKEAFDAFPDRLWGMLDYSIGYGAPEGGIIRRARKRIALEVIKRKNEKGETTITHNWIIQSESDDSIT